MNFSALIPNFSDIFRIFITIFLNGGWVLVIFLIVRIMYAMYRGEVGHQWAHSQEWIFLSIKVPKENLTSTLAVESIFGQMHALHSSLTFAQKYVEGKDQLWYSLELISLGGKVSFVIRTPKKARDLVEAAFYAQYPDAEIGEVADYMENIEYDPDTSDINIWGSEFKLIEDDSIPIKTYRDFEHPSAEEKIIDPLAAHFEALAKMTPYEFYGVQIILQPLGDGEWKPKGENKVKELIGEEVPHEAKFSDILLAPLNWVAGFSFKDTLLGGGHGDHGHGDENKQKNNWQSMTDAGKERVNLIERKIGKPGYRTKIRHIYIAPKDKYDGSKKGVVIGSYRPLGSAMTNQFKPDTKKTWTQLEYNISPSLERPYIEYEEKRRKKLFFKAYKGRDIHIGNPMFVMNTEELATIYHFPLSMKAISSTIEKTESKKSQAPINLPIAEME
jgi:hypothetical protein